MFEICGGPYFTVRFPQNVGSSAHYCANSFVQPQPYYSQGCPTNYYDDSYQQPHYNQYPDQFSGSTSYEDSGNVWSEIKRLLTLLVAKDENTQKMLAEHDTILKNRQTAILDLQRTLEDIARRLDEEEEKEKVQQEQLPKVGYTYVEEGN